MLAIGNKVSSQVFSILTILLIILHCELSQADFATDLMLSAGNAQTAVNQGETVPSLGVYSVGPSLKYDLLTWLSTGTLSISVVQSILGRDSRGWQSRGLALDSHRTDDRAA